MHPNTLRQRLRRTRISPASIAQGRLADDRDRGQAVTLERAVSGGRRRRVRRRLTLDRRWPGLQILAGFTAEEARRMATVAARTVDDIRARRRIGDRVFLRAVCGDVRGADGEAGAGRHLDDLATEGAGFAGFAAGEIGQAPAIRTSPRSRIWRASRRCRGSRTSPGWRAT